MLLNKSGMTQKSLEEGAESNPSSCVPSSSENEEDPEYEYHCRKMDPHEEYSEGTNNSTTNESQSHSYPDI